NAVMHIEDETIDDNTVAEDLMKGYIYKDGRVVRHSMVKVAN
ncbi:MAG: nucleotide exchange factor GrpE, partial [Oscillospiraceae bacterium]